MRFHSFKLHRYITFLNTHPATGQSDESFQAPLDHTHPFLPSSLLCGSPAPSVLQWHHCTAISIWRSSSSSRHTRTISHIRTAALCLTQTKHSTDSKHCLNWTSRDSHSLFLFRGLTTAWTIKHSQPSVSIECRVVFIGVMSGESRYPHLSPPTACQSYWSEPAPPPLHLSLAGPAGRTQSDRGQDSGWHRLNMSNTNKTTYFHWSALLLERNLIIWSKRLNFTWLTVIISNYIDQQTSVNQLLGQNANCLSLFRA